MADAGESKQGKPRDFVSKIVRDPKNPPKTTLLSGFLGQSSEEGHTRLYLDPELCDYVEIPDGAILHVAESKDDSPVAETLVWIQREAQLIHGEAGGARYKASFLEGRISQDYLAGAQYEQADPALGAAFAAQTRPYACPITRAPYCLTIFPVNCPSRIIPLCPTRQLYCPTRQPWCPSRIIPLCPTRQVYCRSVLLTCPTVQWKCPPQSVIIRCGASVVQICQTVAIACQSLAACPTRSYNCPTLPNGCPQPSAQFVCPTIGACPSAVDGCPSAPGFCGDPTFDPTIIEGGWQQGIGY